MPPLSELFDALGVPLAGVAVAFLRVSGVMLLLPGFGDRAIPARVRLVAGLSVAAVIGPLIAVPPGLDPRAPGTILAEVGIGVLLGGAVRIVAQALTIAGTIAAQSASLGQLLGVPSAEPSPALGQILRLGGIALLMASGMHLMVIDLLVRSYDVLPAGLAPAGGDVGAMGVARVAHGFALALGLALPFLIASLLYNMTLGVVSKAMPQLMVSLVGAPAIVWVAMALLAAGAPFVLTAWMQEAVAVLADPTAR